MAPAQRAEGIICQSPRTTRLALLGNKRMAKKSKCSSPRLLQRLVGERDQPQVWQLSRVFALSSKPGTKVVPIPSHLYQVFGVYRVRTPQIPNPPPYSLLLL